MRFSTLSALLALAFQALPAAAQETPPPGDVDLDAAEPAPPADDGAAPAAAADAGEAGPAPAAPASAPAAPASTSESAAAAAAVSAAGGQTDAHPDWKTALYVSVTCGEERFRLRRSDGLSVLVDGTPAPYVRSGESGTAAGVDGPWVEFRVPAGEHTLRFEATGCEPSEQEVTLGSSASWVTGSVGRPVATAGYFGMGLAAGLSVGVPPFTGERHAPVADTATPGSISAGALLELDVTYRHPSWPVRPIVALRLGYDFGSADYQKPDPDLLNDNAEMRVLTVGASLGVGYSVLDRLDVIPYVGFEVAQESFTSKEPGMLGEFSEEMSNLRVGADLWVPVACRVRVGGGAGMGVNSENVFPYGRLLVSVDAIKRCSSSPSARPVVGYGPTMGYRSPPGGYGLPMR